MKSLSGSRAVQDLIDGLEKLDSSFASSAQSRLDAYPEALALLLCAIADEVPGISHASSVLTDLMWRLMDVRDGKDSLKPERPARGGGAKDTYRDATIHGQVAGCVDVLIESAGETLPRACQFVAKALTVAGLRGRKDKSVMPWKTVLEWRSKAYLQPTGDPRWHHAAQERLAIKGWLQSNLRDKPMTQMQLKTLIRRYCSGSDLTP